MKIGELKKVPVSVMEIGLCHSDSTGCGLEVSFSYLLKLYK